MTVSSQHLLEFFSQINIDFINEKAFDRVVEFDNLDFYGHQIQNMFGYDDETSMKLAEEVNQLKVRRL